MPAFAGWVLIGLTSCFWIAAANTLAGWLYVLSGTLLALLGLSIWLPMRSLQGLTVTRKNLYPVSVGDTLSLSLQVHNPSSHGRSLLQYRDALPSAFRQPNWRTIAAINPQSSIQLSFGTVPQKRGQFRWQHLELRTAAPLGLFWCRRSKSAPAHVIIYPQFVPLSRCPLIDQLTAPELADAQIDTFAHIGQDGTTRSLRPYRRGDAMRLIHWRTSARFNELRTRELEVLSGDCPVMIALDSNGPWTESAFESAVIAATSLYYYALHHGFTVRLWTANAGIQQGLHPILETLAMAQRADSINHDPPRQSLLWLTHNPKSLQQLPLGSRSILFQTQSDSKGQTSYTPANRPDLVITAGLDLREALQHS